jgi:uncharacterized protein
MVPVFPMKIHVDQLKPKPERYSFVGSSSWWRSHVAPGREASGSDRRGDERNGAATDAEGDGPFQFEVEAYSLGEDIILTGSLAGEAWMECSRCLRRYRHGLAERFRMVLEPARNRQPADPEGARALARDGMCLDEDLEIGWYQGHEIVLGAFFSELISLALPMQPLCSEGCKGLCPRCGADRNGADCGCEEIKPPSPFAALAALRDEG